jgi:hypothetical protein
MTISQADAEAVARICTALSDAASRLAAAGARTEALAAYEPPRRVALVVHRSERMRPLGRVWRLGVLLLGVGVARPSDSAPPVLSATGSLTRAHEPGRPTFVAASAERRRQVRVAAYRGRFAPGESVNFGARPIPLDESLVEASGPLLVRDGNAFVRWSANTPEALAGFDAYLAERVALLASPPQGA